ncbi:MAG: regulatory protein RecX [Vicingaceae bacterium]
MGKAQKFCVYRDRCVHEMEVKLKDWGLNQEESDAIIDDLVESNFIDEKRFVVAFSRGKFYNNRWGRHKIKMALREKRLKEEDILMALEKLDEKEYIKTARALVQRKWNDLGNIDSRTKNSKVYYYMMSKGFESEVFIPFLKSVAQSKELP